jgi:TfoX/Sxy family transcriptional regulator of competence genes
VRQWVFSLPVRYPFTEGGRLIMPYNEELAGRVRAVFGPVEGVREQRMFGGLSFLVNGNMCCGVLDERLVLRLGNDGAEKALERPHTSPMTFTGKQIRSMVFVSAPAFAADDDLRRHVDEALRFVSILPPKSVGR